MRYPYCFCRRGDAFGVGGDLMPNALVFKNILLWPNIRRCTLFKILVASYFRHFPRELSQLGLFAQVLQSLVEGLGDFFLVLGIGGNQAGF